MYFKVNPGFRIQFQKMHIAEHAEKTTSQGSSSLYFVLSHKAKFQLD